MALGFVWESENLLQSNSSNSSVGDNKVTDKSEPTWKPLFNSEVQTSMCLED